MVFGGQDAFRAGGYEDSALAPMLPFDLSDHFSRQPQFDGMFFVNVPKTALAHPVLRLLPEPAANRERLGALRQLDGSNNVGRFRPLATPLLTRFLAAAVTQRSALSPAIASAKAGSTQHSEVEVPIMAYHAVGDGKVLAAAVDTLWRWQLQPDYDDPPLQALLANAVRFLAPPPRSRTDAPDVRLLDPSPQVGQSVVLSTTLKDKNYDPIRNADLRVTATTPDGSPWQTLNIYPRDLPDQPGYYEYSIPVDAPGAYEVTARYGKEEFTTGFLADAPACELADVSADPAAMETLTRAAGGCVAADLSAWARSADTRPDARPATRNLQVWNCPLMLLAFVALVCMDAFLRKRQGLV
jgi:hypothetical protein